MLASLPLFLAACGSSHSAPATVPAGHRLESMFEAGLQLASDPARTLDTLRSLGVSRVKLFLPWSSVAPASTSHHKPAFDATDPGAYPPGVWDRFDTVVRDAQARGIGVDLALSSPPLWAAGPGDPGPVPHPHWKPSATAFGAFVSAVGKRYSGSYTPTGAPRRLPRVSYWSIWNEPNYGSLLAPQAINHIEVSPLLYRNLLDAAWSALRATGHGSDTILIGELAPRGQTLGNHPGLFDGMVPLRFVRALYCVDGSFSPLRDQAATVRGCPADAAGSGRFRSDHPALFEATGFAIHPYPEGGLPPNQAVPDEPDFADLPALGNLERTLDRAVEAYGSSKRFPIYSTEFGYQTNPPEKLLRTTTPTVAALYLNWAEYISWRDPRIASYDQFLLADPPTANASGGFATGLEFSDGRPKATYAAYRMPIFLPVTTIARAGRAEIWGCVRPARFVMRDTQTPQRVLIQFQPRTGGAFRTLRTVTLTDPDGYFDVLEALPGNGAVRTAWSYPHGPQIVSRSVSVTVR